MDKIRDISIMEAVLHVLDNNSDDPILNNYYLELNEDVYKFIYSHLQRILKDNELRYAIFKNSSSSNLVKDISQKYLDGQINLLETSSYIAKQLFSFMKNSVNIPSCDLFVVSLYTEYGPMLAILKVDYVKHYTHEVGLVDGNVGIRINPIVTGLPTTKKVQKAAFIKPIKVGEEYNLLILDKGKNKDEYAEEYFTDDFLECSVIDNDRDNTRNFMNSTEAWIRNNLSDDAIKAESIRSFLKETLIESDEIDLYDFASDIFPTSEENKKNFIALMQGRDLERIKVDKDYLEKRLSRIKIKVDSDIELTINRDAYEDISRFYVKDNADGSITFMIKNIESYSEK